MPIKRKVDMSMEKIETSTLIRLAIFVMLKKAFKIYGKCFDIRQITIDNKNGLEILKS